MQQVSHQTVRLSKGKHSSPDQGACVMEIASMLAGERFSDHPHSVSRVIGAFLRSYNDALDDGRRQDLYEYAAKVVGSAGSPQTESLRAERVVHWANQMRRRRSWWVPALIGSRHWRERARSPESAARKAITAVGRISDATHAAALRLIDELITLDRPEPSRITAASSPRSGRADDEIVKAR